MTHGEEPGPETHKDSAVLTYLEGLLMHPVVAGPGATVGRRSEAAHSNQQQVDKGGRPPTHGPTAPAAGTNGPSLGATQHLKKARLLRSGAWNDSASQRISSPSVEMNGQGGVIQNGTLEGSPHAGESTLLASLLQSFSSRLQNVAMSQNSAKPAGDVSPPPKTPPEKEPLPVYGTASSRLKGLMRKNKIQNHSNTPYSRRGHSQDRPPESPHSAHSATPPTDSCAERLKAVANMVKIRSSPAPSPKPSVACSQLALLLSSEAHLQQYSREHALKAQLSERLNAPLHRMTNTPLSDGPSGSSTPYSHKELTPPSSQIENLLERRTVLQLLLGNTSATSTPSRKERASGSGRASVEVTGGRNDKSPSVSSVCDSSNGPASDVKVKMEHLEEKGQFSGTSEEPSSRKRPGYEKTCRLSDHQPDVKTEPRPAEVIAKYGLLSQLLKQQTATYYTSSAVHVEPQLRQVKEEQRDYLSPSPKKRRLFSERTDTLNNSNSPRAVEHCTLGFASPGVQDKLDQRRSPKADEAPQRSPPNEVLSKESRGFNVLKQLLLSDNCLKELSPQSRGTASPSVLQPNGKANGSIHSQPSHNHNILSLPGWNPHGHLSSGPAGHNRALSSPPEADGLSRTQWGRQPSPWPVSQKRETPTLVKKEAESPSRWSGPEKEEDDCDSNPNSPRLSRSNPILYYMLQKGSLQLRKEMKNQSEGTHSVVRVKEEPISDLHAYEHSSHAQSPPHNDKHSHKSRGLSQSSE
uniref:Nuclear receptor interacting protein 1 n=1 Tax=Knipowitschia caucasica TaxID=637954 RepID=A0AAV2JFM9_KNICA